jgi:hypothetical protein
MATLHLPIAAPCSEPFAGMSGDEHARFCGKCQKTVHDLSTRTEQEARALLRERAGQRLCVRYLRDTAGGLRFKTALLATAMSVAACGAHTTEPPAATSGDRAAAKCPNPALADAGPNDDFLTGDIKVAPDE